MTGASAAEPDRPGAQRLTDAAVGRCALTSLPFEASVAEYRARAEELSNRLAADPRIIAVYSTGAMSAPGISDIDLIAVCEPGATVRSVWRALNSRTRLLAMHAPFLADRPSFAAHRQFALLEPLERLAGPRIEIEPAPASVASILGTEGLVVALLSIAKQLHAGTLRVRPLLCQLHSLRHSLDLLGLSLAPGTRAAIAVDATAELRSSWLTSAGGDRERRFRALIVDWVQVIADLLIGVGDVADGEAAPLALGAEWRRTTLVPGGSPAAITSLTRGPRTARISRRLAEARWRTRRRLIPVPAGTLGALRGNGLPRADLTGRARVALHYASFLDRNPGGWCALGFPRVFRAAAHPERVGC